MTHLDDFVGHYNGTADWFDDTGAQGAYIISHYVENTKSGFQFRFHHVFDNGDPDVDACFDCKWTQNGHFTVAMAGHVLGKGYIRGNFLHYALPIGENIVESNWLLSSEGLSVFGSATKNSAGNHISWKEALVRQLE